MHPLTRPLLALACLALTRVAQCTDLCSHLILGNVDPDLMEVRVQYDLTKDEKSTNLLIPNIKTALSPGLVWVNATVCNPEKGGHAPYVLKNADEFEVEVHCTYRDSPRCPNGLTVQLQEYYHDLNLL